MNARSTLSALLTMLAIAPLAAQNAADRGRTLSYGDAEWGGSVRVAGHAAFTDTATTPLLHTFAADLGAEFGSNVTLAGHRVEAFHMRGDCDANLRGQFSLQGITYSPNLAIAMTVRIGGATIYRRDATQTNEISFDPATQNVFGSRGFDELVQVGPFTLTVHGNGTADIDCALRPRLALVPPSVGLELAGKGSVEGGFGLSTGVFGFAVGVDGVVDLADPRGAVEVHTNFVSVGGSLSWSFDAIHLLLQVFARSPFVEYRTTLVDNDFAGSRGSLPLGL